jgi:hypothetical protein
MDTSVAILGMAQRFKITASRINVMGEELIQHIKGIGNLVYESHEVGEWLTAKDEPAKRPRRRYLLNGEELDSVSSIVSTLSKGDGLNYWFEDHGARGGVLAERMGELEGVPIEDIVKRVRLLGLGAKAARDRAAARGTAIHEAFHRFALTGNYPILSDYPEEWHGWVRSVALFILELEPQPIKSEFIVCHPEARYAGRPDLLCTIEGQRTLLDYKTGNGHIYDTAHYQTRAYADALPYSEIDPVERILIIGIPDDGSFQPPVECEIETWQWEKLLGVYRDRKRLHGAMATQRKTAKVSQ